MKHRIKHTLQLSAGFAVVALIAASLPVAYGQGGLAERGRSLLVEEGRSIMLHFDTMRRVQITDPQIADVVISSKMNLSVYGKQRGGATLYVWDNNGLHEYEVTVTGSTVAEKVARELRQAIGLGLSYTVVGEEILVIEGQVADTQDAQRARQIANAYSEALKIVDLISTKGRPQVPAAARAEALEDVIDAPVKFRVLDEDTLVVQGDVSDQQQVDQIGKVLEAAGSEQVEIVNLVQYNDRLASPPLDEIQSAIGADLDVWQVRGRTVAVDGTVNTEAETERIQKILDGFSQQANVINLVRVVPDRPPIEEYAQKLSAAFGEDIEVKPMGPETIAVEGAVTNEDVQAHYKQILDTMKHPYDVVNYLRIVEPDKDQVEVRCLIADITDDALERYGVEHGEIFTNPETLKSELDPQPYLFQLERDVNNVYPLGANIEALLDDSDTDILARPRILVNDGNEADILVGGKIPVPVIDTATGGGTNIAIEYKPYGITLNIQPTILEDGEKIALEVNPTVSALDFANGITVSGFEIPALTERSANTKVTIPDGGTLGIGGLLKKEDASTVRRIPVLSEIPIIGELFTHRSFREGRSELVIFVTPRIATGDVRAPGYIHPADQKLREIQQMPER
jgi:Flp pilus assembly secretin CpaC